MLSNLLFEDVPWKLFSKNNIKRKPPKRLPFLFAIHLYKTSLLFANICTWMNFCKILFAIDLYMPIHLKKFDLRRFVHGCPLTKISFAIDLSYLRYICTWTYFVHRQIYRKSNRGNWGHLGGVWYKSITNIFLESHIVVKKCTTLSQMKKCIIKPWDKCITNEICKTEKHLKPCTNLSQIEKSHKKEVDCSTSFFVSLFWSNVDGTFIQQIT